MLNISRYFMSAVAVLCAFTTTAFAGSLLGVPAGDPLSVAAGTGLPFAEGGILGLVAAGVIGGVWLARRKR